MSDASAAPAPTDGTSAPAPAPTDATSPPAPAPLHAPIIDAALSSAPPLTSADLAPRLARLDAIEAAALQLRDGLRLCVLPVPGSEEQYRAAIGL